MLRFKESVQHAFREGRDVAFTGAGLVASVTGVVDDVVLTFLRRAGRYTLGSVSRTDPTRRGNVDFALPFLRQYLREQPLGAVTPGP